MAIAKTSAGKKLQSNAAKRAAARTAKPAPAPAKATATAKTAAGQALQANAAARAAARLTGTTPRTTPVPKEVADAGLTDAWYEYNDLLSQVDALDPKQRAEFDRTVSEAAAHFVDPYYDEQTRNTEAQAKLARESIELSKKQRIDTLNEQNRQTLQNLDQESGESLMDRSAGVARQDALESGIGPR